MQMIRYVAVFFAICFFSSVSAVFAAVKPVTQPVVSPEQAAVLSLNRISNSSKGITVENRRHNALFRADGFDFTPQRGPHWTWSLDYFGPAGKSSTDGSMSSVNPVRFQPDIISYPRTGVTERYMLKRQTIEQQFVIPQPLALEGADLLVSGKIETEGKLESGGTSGWLWRDDKGVVTLGRVTVIDAKGQRLPAEMQVAQNSTLIRVDGKALAGAVYPVVIDPVIGSQISVSDMGSGSNNRDGINPDVVYNSTDNEYLVVWFGDETVGQKFEIFGQRINAATGAVVAPDDFLIGSMPGNDTFDAVNPAVAYNADKNEYLVVWEGNDVGIEIFGRIVSAAGVPQGSDPTRISFMGGTAGDATREAHNPDTCYNTATQQYLVVWAGDDNTLVNDEVEVFGRFADSALMLVGNDDVRISDLGGDGNNLLGADNPAVACNNTGSGEYYVVWWGDDVENQDMEIYAQRLNASGIEVGDNDKKISLFGGNAPVTDDGFRAQRPDVAYNSVDNRYLVVWRGGDMTAPAAGDGFEVYGQLINATDGSEIAPDDFQISSMGGTEGDVTREARFPAVAYNSMNNEYISVWEGDDDTGANDAFQIYASVIADDGTVSNADMPVSAAGVTATIGVVRSTLNAGPAIAFGATSAQHLVAWEEAVVADDFEIVARAVSGPEATFRLTEPTLTVAEDAGTATVTVQRIGNTTNAVTVDIATTAGTAGLTDFTDASATLSFAENETEKTVSISITDDGVDEGSETINIALSNPAPSGEAGIASSGATAVLTITDNGSGGGGGGGGGGTDDGDSGGGCALSANSGFDPVLLLLMLIAGGYLLSRRVVLH
jgi:hypothetical protein